MVSALGDRLRRFKSSLQEAFIWLSFRKNAPQEWFKGSYSPIKLVRMSLVIIALLNFSAVALGSPDWNAATTYSLWLGFASAIYVIVAIVYFLGLRMWYAPSSIVLLLSGGINYAFDSAGGPDALTPFTSPSFNDIIALSWVYLIVVGVLIMRYDKGSKLNELLQQS